MRARRRAPWKPLNEDGGPWLIWSHYHGCWHRRSADGGACGYTDDIGHAGVFDLAKARQYHNPPPERRDEAIAVSKVVKALEARKAEMLAEHDALAERIRALGEVTHAA